MLTMQGRASRQIRRLTGVSVIRWNFSSCFSSKWSSMRGPAFLVASSYSDSIARFAPKRKRVFEMGVSGGAFYQEAGTQNGPAA